MISDRQKLGKAGENIAKKYLQERGYELITSNFRTKKGEIDIICRKSDDLVLVEVKSLRMTNFGSGEERISKIKQKKLIKTTYQFLEHRPEFESLGIRFDVIVVNFVKYPAQISHYQGAFWEG
jgi:putative endonuclease